MDKFDDSPLDFNSDENLNLRTLFKISEIKDHEEFIRNPIMKREFDNLFAPGKYMSI